MQAADLRPRKDTMASWVLPGPVKGSITDILDSTFSSFLPISNQQHLLFLFSRRILNLLTSLHVHHHHMGLNGNCLHLQHLKPLETVLSVCPQPIILQPRTLGDPWKCHTPFCGWHVPDPLLPWSPSVSCTLFHSFTWLYWSFYGLVCKFFAEQSLAITNVIRENFWF